MNGDLSVRRVVSFLFFVVSVNQVSGAALPARSLPSGIVAPLLAANAAPVTLRDIPLGQPELDSLELEPFSLWAEEPHVLISGADGKQERVAVPVARFFRGVVKGRDDSAVYFRVGPAGEINGLVLLGEKRFAVGRSMAPANPRKADEEPMSVDSPLVIAEVDPLAEGDPSATWSCAIDRNPMLTSRLTTPGIAAAQSLKPIALGGGLTTTTYNLKLSIHTDYELYAGLGSSASAVTTYVENLVGAASAIFSRDVRTTLQIAGTPIIVTSPTAQDQLTTAPPDDVSLALAELGKYWHDTYPNVQRSAVVMVSGKLFNSGIAWENTVCGNDVYCGDDGSTCGSTDFAGKYMGAYAFCGSSFTVSATVPGNVPYTLPNDASFWMLLAFCHEVGHLCNGPHTNCVTLTAAEKSTYGVTRDYVDLCEGAETETGCYSGTPSSPTELGTIMSACQNFFGTGGYRQSRYTFGQSGEPSAKIPPYLISGIDQATPVATITLGACPSQSASVASCTGCTYAWVISSGTINSGQSTNSITFTATLSGTLNVTITNSHSCSISNSVAVGPCLSAPASVTATPIASQSPCGNPSVQVTWASVTNATGYTLLRCGINHCASTSDFTFAGSTTALSFTDGGCRTDLTPPLPNTAYIYKVVATAGASSSPYSTGDLATTILFTDDPITTGVTVVKAVHVSQLRTAVAAVCTLAGTTAPGSPPVAGNPIAAAYINTLRTLLDSARAALGLSAMTYADNPLNPSGQHTIIKKAHIVDLRNGVR